MATQLKHTDFTYKPPASRPNIRVAFIAGAAVTAVNDPAANLPAEKTLEELAITDAATAAIAQAKAMLSPAVYAAFLRWGDTATRFSTVCDDDASSMLCDVYTAACGTLTDIPAVNTHDMALKVWLLNIDAMDAPPFGPTSFKNPVGLTGVIRGVQADIMRTSPLVRTLEDLAAEAWKLSVNDMAWDVAIGVALTSAFVDAIAAQDAEPTGTFREMLAERNALTTDMDEGPARTDEEYAAMGATINRLEATIIKRPAESADDAAMKLIAIAQITAGGHEVEDTEAACVVVEARKHFGIGHVHRHLLDEMPKPLTALPPSYDPYMRGPYIQWQQAYARYEAAAAELAQFDREVHTPAERKWTALSKGLNDQSPAAAFEASSAASAELDIAQDRYDALLSLEGDAIDELLCLTAPGPSELAVKLQLFSKTYGWNVCSDPKVGKQITIDARRFAHHGALLQTDEPLLEAYAARRREYESHANAATTEQNEDAYYERCDALEAVMQGTKATTIEGVLAKLRIAFKGIVGKAWSDLAISNPTSPVFVEGLRMDDVFTQLAWSAIEDLARVGGVSLAEQGR